MYMYEEEIQDLDIQEVANSFQQTEGAEETNHFNYSTNREEEVDGVDSGLEEEEIDEGHSLRLASDSIRLKTPLKDLGALEEYISNEGNIPSLNSKC